MYWFLMTFWRSLAALSGLVGVLYLWSDIEGLPQALAKPREILMDNREIILFWFCVFLVVLVVWRDIGPFLRQFIGITPSLSSDGSPKRRVA
jgi:hypothetical protein